MSWGERSCGVQMPCRHNPTMESCNVYCPAYIWDGKTEPDSGPGLTRTQKRLLAALLRSEPKTTFCTWSEDDDGNWSSSCGNAWSMEAGTPQENGYAYCPNCGAQIEHVEHVGVIDDEDEPKEESHD